MDSVIVVGGGIVGTSAAYHLARSGAQVMLIDQAQPGQATAAGAGIIAPGTSFRPPAAFFPLAFPAVAYYEELLANLGEDGEHHTGYETVGLLHVATSEEEATRLPLLFQLFVERRAAGVKNLGDVRLLSDQEALSRAGDCLRSHPCARCGAPGWAPDARRPARRGSVARSQDRYLRTTCHAGARGQTDALPHQNLTLGC